MIEIEQLILVIIGIIIGSILGTEYASWRMMRKARRYEDVVLQFLGIEPGYWKTLSVGLKKKRLAAAFRQLISDMFPESNLVAPSPSTIVSLDRRQFFVPQCPKCQYVGAPVMGLPGNTVKAECPEHGVFHVVIPETKKEKEE